MVDKVKLMLKAIVITVYLQEMQREVPAEHKQYIEAFSKELEAGLDGTETIEDYIEQMIVAIDAAPEVTL